jgi:hypothetical protein
MVAVMLLQHGGYLKCLEIYELSATEKAVERADCESPIGELFGVHFEV